MIIYWLGEVLNENYATKRVSPLFDSKDKVEKYIKDNKIVMRTSSYMADYVIEHEEVQ